MASGGLLAVLDDITIIMDDVAAMSKVAAKKTAGIVGDDLAVNANVVVGLEPARELPIVGKIALGSLVNKAILIPLALVLPTSFIGPLLMVGGAFLCYEALHKVTHSKNASEKTRQKMVLEVSRRSPGDLLAVENEKVRGAVATDFILSAEVIAVALAAVAAAPWISKAVTLTFIGLAMTVGVYGLVACIVKVDDLGLLLQKTEGSRLWARFRRGLGRFLVAAMPYGMKSLSILGTLAMFTVGGGIVLHGIPGAEARLKAALLAASASPWLSGALELLALVLFGAIVGALATPVFHLVGRGIAKAKERLRSSSADTGGASGRSGYPVQN